MKTSSEYTEPKVIKKMDGLMPGMFNDDFTFTFKAKDVHYTDPKEMSEMLAHLDEAVLEYKKAAKGWVKTGPD
jgi:hypothetical protein